MFDRLLDVYGNESFGAGLESHEPTWQTKARPRERSADSPDASVQIPDTTSQQEAGSLVEWVN
eukprot:1030710-Alexandrium_andersonii.AAC.1